MGKESTQDQLRALRDRLDQVDGGMIELAAERQRIVSEIGRVKQGEGRQLRDFRRERQVIELVRAKAERVGLDPAVAEDLLKRLITASLTRQEQERGKLAAQGVGRRALIIGGGGLMGGWLAGFLENQGFDVLLADPVYAESASATNCYARWQDAPADVDLIVVAAPIRASVGIIDTLTQAGSKALVFEVASIKSPLIDPLRRAAQSGLTICSVHPMFGPDTRLLSGRHVLLMDAGCSAAVDQVADLFADTMAEVTRIPLADHDRLIALVLGLSHAINIAFFTALEKSGVRADQLAGISSTTFQRQLDIARDVAEENPDLYFEIQSLNEHAPAARAALNEAVQALQASIDEGDADAFRSLMLSGRGYLGRLGGPKGER
ncbi:MAG: prephenate dehydrogenase/arogenate dehydrogenase family protein [Wenzhouxiangella sp.]